MTNIVVALSQPSLSRFSKSTALSSRYRCMYREYDWISDGISRRKGRALFHFFLICFIHHLRLGFHLFRRGRQLLKARLDENRWEKEGGHLQAAHREGEGVWTREKLVWQEGHLCGVLLLGSIPSSLMANAVPSSMIRPVVTVVRQHLVSTVWREMQLFSSPFQLFETSETERFN
jgi:hypothetical protein